MPVLLAMNDAVEEAYKRATIKGWAEEDRPREKLMLKGRSSLSNAELLAVLLGSGTPSLTAVDLAKLILESIEYDLNRLAKLTIQDLRKYPGVGEAKAISIVSAMELGRRRVSHESQAHTKITCSQDAYDAIATYMLDKRQEEFWILLLDRANHVLHKCQVSAGGVAGTIADPKIIFKLALDHLASSVILVHNHPSGNLSPSEADRRLTKRMVQAGEFLETPVLDHLIIGDADYFSFRDENLM